MGEPCLGIEREWGKKNEEGNEKKGYVNCFGEVKESLGLSIV